MDCIAGRRHLSESQQTHFRSDAQWCGPDEKEPLSCVVCDQNQVCAIWNRFHEHVPGEDEVGEDEQNCSDGEYAASLQEGCQHHCPDKAGVDGNACFYDSRFCCRYDFNECRGQEGYGAEHDHDKVAFCLHCQLFIMLDFFEVSVSEIDDEPDVRDCKCAHLQDEMVA